MTLKNIIEGDSYIPPSKLHPLEECYRDVTTSPHGFPLLEELYEKIYKSLLQNQENGDNDFYFFNENSTKYTEITIKRIIENNISFFRIYHIIGDKCLSGTESKRILCQAQFDAYPSKIRTHEFELVLNLVLRGYLVSLEPLDDLYQFASKGFLQLLK